MVRKRTGIPVSVGIGPTKVLAKIAASLAKKHPEYGGVIDLSGADAKRYLKDFDVADVWGIGPRYAKFLKFEGEANIFSLPGASDVTVELYGGAVVLRLEGELRRVHIRRFDPITFPTEEEARHAFMRLWREVEMLESATAIELAAERWLEAGR